MLYNVFTERQHKSNKIVLSFDIQHQTLPGDLRKAWEAELEIANPGYKVLTFEVQQAVPLEDGFWHHECLITVEYRPGATFDEWRAAVMSGLKHEGVELPERFFHRSFALYCHRATVIEAVDAFVDAAMEQEED